MIVAASSQFYATDYAREGLLALQRGQYRLSRALLTKSVQLDPTLAEAWRWLGALHSGAKRAICLQWAQRTQPHATIPRLPHVKVAQPATIAPTPRMVEARPRRRMHRVAVVAGGAMLAATLALGGFELAYAQRVYPGVQAFGQSLSGMAQADAAAAIQPTLTAWSGKNIIVNLGDQQAIVPLNQLANFDADSVAHQAFSIGREGNPFQRITTQGKTWLNAAESNVMSLDSQRVTSVLNALEASIKREPVAASFARNDDGSWRIVPEQPGIMLDRTAATELLQQWWSAVDWNAAPHGGSIDLALQQVPSPRTAAQLAPYLETLNRQTAQPLVVNIAGNNATFDRSTLLDLKTMPSMNAPFSTNDAALQLLVSDLASQYDRAPQASYVVRDGNRARDWRLGQRGIMLDQQAAMKQLSAALQSGESAPVELAFAETPPPAGDLEALGITGIVGRGNSQFASYSSPNRDANVVAGGNEFDGLLVPPGELLSFTGTVGDITFDEGYQMGEMISGGVVVPSLGGGICQVSTTLFRAAFWAGLPIEERHNHDWRLPWYEVDAPAGMDATIALGGPDLKIRNNTAGYLLIDVETDTVNKTQTFTIYGTPNQQEVSMIDGYSGGAIVITRQIKQNGAVVQEDSWTSYYSQ